jgi:hypothetical protein
MGGLQGDQVFGWWWAEPWINLIAIDCHFPQSLAKCCLCHVMFVFSIEAFLCHCLRAVGEMCAEMEHVGSSDCWVSSITSGHEIWAKGAWIPKAGATWFKLQL